MPSVIRSILIKIEYGDGGDYLRSLVKYDLEDIADPDWHSKGSVPLTLESSLAKQVRQVAEDELHRLGKF
jgi:hypothetical protein